MCKRAILLFLLLFCSQRMFAACSGSSPNLTAASASRVDVNACVSIAVDGDTVNVPAGSQTWTSGITISPSTGISIIGAGIGSTVITVNGSFNVFNQSPTLPLHSTLRISGMTIQPIGGLTGASQAIALNGTCRSTTPYCPNVRIDHVSVPNSWDGTGLSHAAIFTIGNFFGVIDHNTIGDVTPAAYGIVISVSHNGWRGVGDFGDNSYATASTFGTFQALYIENNTFNYSIITDTDDGSPGGPRFVCRFNTINTPPDGFGACVNHGTETTGRPRTGRQQESYGNVLNCSNNVNNCATTCSLRGGTCYAWGNTLAVTNGASWLNYLDMRTERTYRATSIWGYCAGVSPWDKNDGMTEEYSGTVSSSTSSTVTVSGTPWSANAFNFSTSSPGAKYYVAFDNSTGDFAGIASNTANVLTLSWKWSTVSSVAGAVATYQPGYSLKIYSVTLYGAGTQTGASGTQTLTDNTKSWTPSQWVVSGDAYSVLDVTNGGAVQIQNSGTNTLSSNFPYDPWTFSTGDKYAILRSSVCLDQPNVSGGVLFTQGGVSGQFNLVPFPYGATTETVDPSYTFANTGVTPTSGSIGNPDNITLIEGRDYFSQVSTTAQTSSSSPFAGTTGTGYGIKTRMPATCTAGVGYFAVDEGSWNSGNLGKGADNSGGAIGGGSNYSGNFYICTVINTWTLSYTPYTYPHPLVSGTPAPAPAPASRRRVRR